ncbi:MAG: hypothetical protein ACKOSQ_08945 [Planctomycetaceae bacterium]
MQKLLAFTGLVVAGLVTILFIADLAAGFPFQRASVATDVGFVVSGLIVAYLSWSLMPKA